MGRKRASLRDLSEELRTFALGLPGAVEDYPWGERVMKVNKKVFVFLGRPDSEEKESGMAVKLPASNAIALGLPFTEPTGYGLGKSGWVNVKLLPGETPPADMLKEWILESYRAIAPKKLSAQLDDAAAPPPPAPGPARPARAASRAKASPPPRKRPAKR